MMSTRYEVTMGPAATRAVLSLPHADRKGLADALRTELLNGPNADKVVSFDAADRVYSSIPLTFDAYVAVYRSLTQDELRKLGRQERRRAAATGFYILEILDPGTAFRRGPRMVGP